MSASLLRAGSGERRISAPPLSGARWSGARERWMIAAPLVFVYAVLVVRTAWVMDDAYISFRCVDNLVHGFGLRWNTFERVDAFTNPLWTLVLSAFVAVTREVYYTGLLLQIALSVAAFVILVMSFARTNVTAVIAFVILAFSKAFVDYSTSGLENPLSHLLLVLFAWTYFRDTRENALWRQVGLASLALVNRLDLVWLLLPCLALSVTTVARRSPRRAWRDVAVGLAPLVAWELFSLFYYGALIPNSALAKLTSHAASELVAWHGWSYYRDSLQADPVTLVVSVLGLSFALVAGSARARAMAAGLGLTLVYIARVGGDHMSGRFFSVPLLVAAILLVELELSRDSLALLAGAVGLSSWAAGFPTLNESYSSLRPGTMHDINDYRREWYPSTGLLSRSLTARGPDHEWVNIGKQAKEHPGDVPIWGGIGFAGYYAGPRVRVLDPLGLSDPLLARLPIPDGRHESYFKMGHFHRSIPDGYLETVRDGRNEIRHPALHAYYDKVAFITQGPLWSGRRILEIFRWNLGAYDGLLEDYVRYQEPKPVQASSLPPASAAHGDDATRDCPSWWRPCARVGATFSDAGLRVMLGTPSSATAHEVELTAACYDISYWRDYAVVGQERRTLAAGRTSLEVDPATARNGYDAVSFRPCTKSDSEFAINFFR
jgi:arabinofuranosyltransferase